MKLSLLIAAGFIFLWISSFNGCRKENIGPEFSYSPYGPPPVLTESFTQEFDSYFEDLKYKGWVFRDKSIPSNGGWVKGLHVDKINSGPHISPAYSFTNGDPFEFAYVGDYNYHSIISSWMFSPPVKLKNGDKISFYTKGDSIGINRLEIRLNEKDTTSVIGSGATDVGKFTKLIGSVNPSLLIDGYPRVWTRIEITVTGLPNSKTTRIAFRYYVTNQKEVGAIGIDQLKFQKS